MEKICLAMDLGGTKLELAIVNARGEILALRKHLLDLQLGKDGVLQQLADWGMELIRDFPQVQSVGVSSCGPLDPVRGLLLDATNLLTDGKGWGVVPLREYLAEHFSRPTYLDNDAACSALAERWLGVAKKKQTENFMVLTLGTGLGAGIVCNGELFRSGRFRHPESGHTIVDYKNTISTCSCGVSGDSESFLSGSNFAKHFNERYHTSYSAKEIASLARTGDARALTAFETYAEVMAATLHNYAVIFCPEWIFFSGSFAETFDIFSERTHQRLTQLLQRNKDIIPQLCVSELENHSCLLGAASLCFNQNTL